LFYRGLAFSRAPLIGDTLATVTQVVALRQNTPRAGRAATGLAALRIVTQEGPPPDYAAVVADWRLDVFARRTVGPRPADLHAGLSFEVAGGDVVSSAPELARLTANIAAVHHDRSAGDGERLVYGGHAIGLALSQAARALPSMVTVTGWRGCDHLAPVREGDTLRSTVTVEQVEYLPGGGGLVHLRSLVRADAPAARDVLDWRYVAVLA
jgi:acyl dehydratase